MKRFIQVETIVRVELLEFLVPSAVLVLKIKLYPDIFLFLVGLYIHLLAAFVKLKQKVITRFIIDLKGQAFLIGTVAGSQFVYFLNGISDIRQRLATFFGIVFL